MAERNAVADALRETLISPNVSDRNMEDANVVDTLDNCASGLQRIGRALERLGLDEASTPLGAIEVLSKEIKEGSERIADALTAIAEAIRERDE